jgi:hypothetical protein
MADEFRFLPPWLGGGTNIGIFNGFAPTAARAWLLLPVAALILGALAAWRTRRSDDRRMIALATALFVVGVFAISRADEPRAYTFEWRVVVAAFVIVAGLRAISAWAPRPRLVVPIAGTLALAVAVWGAVDLSTRVTDNSVGPLEARSVAIASMLPLIRSTPTARRVLVRPAGASLRSLFDGVIDELDRHGVDVRVDPQLGRIFGGHRRATPQQADEIWYVTEEGSFVPALLAQPGARTVASTSPLDRAENAELDRLQAKLRTELQRAGKPHAVDFLDQPLFALLVRNIPGLDTAAAARISALNEKVARDNGCRCTIVAVPGGRSGDRS